MSEVDDALSFRDELASALLADDGPDMRRVTAAIDRFLRTIEYPSDVAAAAKTVFDVEDSPAAGLAPGFFWFRVGHWIRAREVLRTRLDPTPDIPPPLEGLAWYCLAECEYKLREYEPACRLLERAKHLAERTGHVQLKALALLLAAKIAFKRLALDELDQRLEETGRTLRGHAAWSIPATLADIRGQVAIYYGRVDEARATFHQAEEQARATGDSRALAAVLRDLLRLHLLVEDHPQAERTIRRLREVAWEAHDWLGEAAVLAMEGDFFHGQKEYANAEERYREAARFNAALEYAPGQAVCAIALARNALARRKPDTAHRHLQEAMDLIENADVSRHRSDAYLAYALLGEAERAEDLEQRYVQLKESFASCPHGYRYSRAMFNYGCFLAKRGRLEEAAQHLAEAYEKATPLQAPLLGRIRDLLMMPSEQWATLWGGLYRRLQSRSSELAVAKTQLERLTRQRKSATAMLVHDLKNQLATLVATLGTAQALGASLPLGDKDYVPLLLANARTITGRLESLTEFWRAEITGVLEPNLREIAIDEILDSVARVGQLLTINDIEWRMQTADGIPPVTCDSHQVQRVFENLIFNARTYALSVHTGRRHVTVEVVWNAREDELRASVINSGPTIPPEKLEDIFERFVRVSYDNREEVGESLFNRAHVGLGLFYCRQVLTAHGGRIWAENLDDHSGVRFSFTLPRHPPVAE